MTVYERLNKVQQELKAPKAQKNSFGGYNYRSAEDILEAVKPLLDKHELTLTISDTIAHLDTRFYVCAEVTVTDGEKIISTTAYAREQEVKKGMDAAQITGAASSYARKYALSGLFAIDDNKDPDTYKPEHNVEAPSEKQIKYLKGVAKTYQLENGNLARTLEAMSEEVIGRQVETAEDAQELFEKLKEAGVVDA